MYQRQCALCLSLFLLGFLNQPVEGAGQPSKSSTKKTIPKTSKAAPAKGDGWNSGLSDMMDQIETQIPGSPKGSLQKPSPSNQPPAGQAGPGYSPPDITPSDTSVATPSDTTFNTASEAVDKATASKSDTTEDDINGTSNNYFAEISRSGISRWSATRRPLKIYIQKASNANGFRAEFASILEQAFNDWAEASPAARLSYAFISNPSDSDIACTWTDSKSDMMSSLEGGITLVIPERQGIKRADIKILTLPPQDLPSISSNYMRHITLHEVGHALGLSGHSGKPEDIMFGTIYPKDEACHLTERDKSTLTVLYAQPDSVVASRSIDPVKAMATAGVPSTPKARALDLSNRAAKAMASNQLELALSNLEEAHKLDPGNAVIGSNLGAIYANLGSVAGMTFNFPRATSLFKKAIPLLEKGPDKRALLQVLGNYLQVLRATRANPGEQKLIEAKIAKLR